jgi:serine/threonine protein kinase
MAEPSTFVATLPAAFQPRPGSGAADGRAPAPGAALPSVPGHEILEVIGRGGMGVVYKARHVELDRIVALKMVLAGGHAGAEHRKRFRVEAEAVARLQHPNIVQIYEVGEHEGRPFFSLEFCAGGGLDRTLKGALLPPGDAAWLVETLARAVHAAHEQHVVHRDLKPAHVLLTADGTPKITDFGLAKRLDDAGQTRSGETLGTPSYMAPEQAQGKSDETGPAADVYSLGAILYECLTGRPPFCGATAVETRSSWSAMSRSCRGGCSRRRPATWRQSASSAWRSGLAGGTRRLWSWRTICSGSRPASRCGRGPWGWRSGRRNGHGGGRRWRRLMGCSPLRSFSAAAAAPRSCGCGPNTPEPTWRRPRVRRTPRAASSKPQTACWPTRGTA